MAPFPLIMTDTMTVKRRGLGRGLDALLGPAATPPPKPSEAAAPGRVPVDLLERSRFQPRAEIKRETLEELADSIRAQGLMQPIVVRPLPGSTGPVRYEIIAGERRWRAAQMAGLGEVPVVVRDVPDDVALALALIENIQREDLSPLDEARALERLVVEFGMTHERAAEAVGRSRTAVSNLIRLLELDDAVKQRLASGELDMGHARALLALPRSQQAQAAARVAERGLSVRETERLVKRLIGSPSQPMTPRVDPDVQRLERELSERLGAKVEVHPGARGSGQLVIRYHSLDELEGILAHIR
jgi:ParB family transcriptional regulator, chromosome partitioning protein